jgi:hypothetical protein
MKKPILFPLLKYLFVVLFILIGNFSHAQDYYQQKIKAKGDYIQKATNTTFPKQIGKYYRSNITAFDENEENVGVTYQGPGYEGKTTFTVYIYPAGNATEDKLRNEYSKCLRAIFYSTLVSNHAIQALTSYSNSNYKVHGIYTCFPDYETKTALTIFGCGSWFFKIRITSGNMDTSQINTLQNSITNYFIPSRLVSIKPLNPKVSVYYNKSEITDSVILGSAMKYAFKMIEWVFANVDSFERAAGFSGVYLQMYIEGLKTFTEFEKEHPELTKTSKTSQYLIDLNSIIDNGYLEEFIMDQYNWLLISPDGIVFDLENYDQWKKNNPISINLLNKIAILSFDAY